MSKISSCFQLCPLIDQKGFLGVSDDCDSSHVIVTLGRNMVIRYRISDQKQVNSWSTKTRLSSPVVYDRESGQYVGVFNMKTIQMWSEYDVDLSKVKKYKFKCNIHCVVSTSSVGGSSLNSPLVIVFKDGRIAPLTATTLKERNRIATVCEGMPPLIDNPNTTAIEDVHMITLAGNVVIVLVTVDSRTSKLCCCLMPLQRDLFQPISFDLNDSGRVQNEAKLTSHVFLGGDTFKLFTLWSDGSLYCLDLYMSTLDEVTSLYPGEEVMKLSVVNTQLKVAVLPLDKNGFHIAIYGADPSEEGALLAIVDVRHRLVQSEYPFKLYCTSPKLWSAGPTDLLLIVGRHLAVAHYKLIRQKLAALVGTQLDNTTPPPVKSCVWQSEDQQTGHKTTPRSRVVASRHAAPSFASCDKHSTPLLICINCNHIPIDDSQLSKLTSSISSLFAEGLSEAGVLDRAVPIFMESHSTEELIYLCERYDDMSTECLLDLIDYCVYDEDIDLNVKILGKLRDTDRILLLRKVLGKSVVADSRALSLVAKKMTVVSSVTLIRWLSQFMAERPCDASLIGWATLLLDAFYLTYIGSKNVHIVKTMQTLAKAVDNQVTLLTTWQQMLPLMKMIQSGKGVPENLRGTDTSYSLDSLHL